jgi:hypothetical protein
MTFRRIPPVLLLIPLLVVMACVGSGASGNTDNPTETPDSKPLVTQPVTSAPTSTTAVTPTPAPTQPPSKAPFEWDGTWILYLPVSDDKINQAVFVVSGNTVTTEYTSGDPGFEENLILTGTLTADGMGVTGTWENLTYGNSGPFRWQFVPENGHQFVGSYNFVGDEPQPYCGSRSGAPQPDPCMWP